MTDQSGLSNPHIQCMEDALKPAFYSDDPNYRPLYNLARALQAASNNLPFQWQGMPRRQNTLREKRDTVVRRANDQYWNNCHGVGTVELLTSLTIGSGLRILPAIEEAPGISVDAATLMNADLIRLWQRVNRIGQLDGAPGPGRRRRFEVLESDIHTEQATSGEMYVHRVENPARDKDLGLELELIGGERIVTPSDLSGESTIIDGIEYTDEQLSEVKAYWVNINQKNPSLMSQSGKDFKRIPARDMAVFSEYAPPDVYRALSALTQIILSSEMDAMYLEDLQFMVALMAKLPAWVERTEQQPGALPSMATSWEIREAANGLRYSGYTSDFTSGTILDMKRGDKVHLMNDHLPSPDLPGYRKAIKQAHAIALNLPLVFLDKDLTGISYSGGQFAWQNAKPVITRRQQRFISSCQSIWEWFIESAMLSNAVSLPGYTWERRRFYTQANYIPPQEPVINPVDRENAHKLGLVNGTTSRTRICLEDGKIYPEVIRERAREWKEAKDIADAEGVPLSEVYPEIPSGPEHGPTNAGNPNATGEEAPVKGEKPEKKNGKIHAGSAVGASLGKRIIFDLDDLEGK